MVSRKFVSASFFTMLEKHTIDFSKSEAHAFVSEAENPEKQAL